ncbi:hypothetical protein OO006_07020 [Prosthecochloris sp. SCSIO W1101]|uniref:hypothetical protein n=1 Tax=Prosthecochloris sp. SCSIO W1101 TaxID=2992242 RepID=UPI00223E0C03|nr:hypothetical protein [Prosthecochloris sp. SCSIO W1101]UZJ42690.1 hypothetical protein OO006_07020 [Prosthecochloris sp. SCSIO W1101]
MDPRVKPEDDFKRGVCRPIRQCHTRLDAAPIDTLDRRWIPGSRFACPRMTWRMESCRTRCGIHTEQQENQ